MDLIGRDDIVQFRREYPDKFAGLCKIHLSFVLDKENYLTSPSFKAPRDRGSQKRTVNTKKTKEAHGVCATLLTPAVVRSIVLLINHLRKENHVETEGLFRKSGSISRQHALKVQLSAGLTPEYEKNGYTAHDCACVLKNLLSSLAEPLLTSVNFPVYCKIPGLCQQGAPLLARRSAYRKQLKVAQLLLLLLPLPNYEVVVKLLGLLHNVSKAPHKDCMSPESLAKIFTPVIFCPREMAPDEMQANSAELARPVAFLIEHAPAVISYPEDLVEDVESWSRRMKQSLASPKDAATEPVHTVVTFCARREVTKVSVKAYTEQALAELHKHVDEMPNTQQKKRFVKQLNKENSAGTPVFKRQKHQRSKTLGEATENPCVDFNPVPKVSCSCSLDEIQLPPKSPGVEANKCTTGKPSVLATTWRFLRKKHDPGECGPSTSFDNQKGKPLCKSMLRASRRVKVLCHPTFIGFSSC